MTMDDDLRAFAAASQNPTCTLAFLQAARSGCVDHADDRISTVYLGAHRHCERAMAFLMGRLILHGHATRILVLMPEQQQSEVFVENVASDLSFHRSVSHDSCSVHENGVQCLTAVPYDANLRFPYTFDLIVAWGAERMPPAVFFSFVVPQLGIRDVQVLLVKYSYAPTHNSSMRGISDVVASARPVTCPT